MKKLIFITILFISSAFSVAAQSACPIISVIGSAESVVTGENIVFDAKVQGINLEKITYRWTLSEGRILKGQEHSTLTVATNSELAGKIITATVEIGNISQHCSNIASYSVEVVDCFFSMPNFKSNV